MIHIPNLIMIGSAGRNSGKTFLACALIKRLKEAPVALKVTGIEKTNGVCPRGGKGCGACSLAENFCLEEEVDYANTSQKDTSMMLAAGAKKVFWLRCLRSSFEQGFAAFLQKIEPRKNDDAENSKKTKDDKPLIICESNSLRNTIEPGLFIMIMNHDGETIKKSAAEVAAKADITLLPGFKDPEIDAIVEMITVKMIN